jgi:hypothetical protein
MIFLRVLKTAELTLQYKLHVHDYFYSVVLNIKTWNANFISDILSHKHDTH